MGDFKLAIGAMRRHIGRRTPAWQLDVRVGERLAAHYVGTPLAL